MAFRPLLPFQTRALGALGPGSDPFLTLHREMNRMFDDVFRSSSVADAAQSVAFVPMHMDITENDNEIRITAELAGVSENDIQVELNDDQLTIRGEKRSQHEDQQHHIRERSYGAFSRTIQLPFAADPNRLEATFANGVLTVTVPRTSAQQQSHRIQVKAGAPVQSTQARSGQSGGAQLGGEQKASGQPAGPGQGTTPVRKP